MDFRLIILALGIMLIFEGIPYFAFPEATKRFMNEVQQMPDKVLRIFGFIALVAGLLLIFLGSRILG
jgi:uncharacterized protein